MASDGAAAGYTMAHSSAPAAPSAAPNRRRGGGGDEAPPELYSIHRGKVVKVESYGCFVALDGRRRNGLVHVSQLADHRVESAADVVTVGDAVYAKVIGIDADPSGGSRIKLSMKYASQSDGRDLDPDNGSLAENEFRGGGGRRSGPEIKVGDALDPMAAVRGGHAADALGNVYEFVADDAGEPPPPPPPPPPRAAPRQQDERPPVRPMGRGAGASKPAWMTNPAGDKQRDKAKRKALRAVRREARAERRLEKKKKKSKKKKKKSKHKSSKSKKEKHSKRDRHDSSSSSSDSGSESASSSDGGAGDEARYRDRPEKRPRIAEAGA